MADFPVFSLGQAMQQGQNLAINQAKMQDIGANRQKASKAAGLRQRIGEGDHEAFAELMAVDPDSAKKTLDMINTMEKGDRETMKAQNESIAKAMMWVMDAPTEQERAARWDQSVDHLVQNQGMKDVAQYKGKYDQALAQKFTLQAMTMDQLLDQNKGSFGNPKAAKDKDGKPVLFVTDKEGKSRILTDVSPTDKDLYGKKGKDGGAGGIKPSASRVIEKAVMLEMDVPFKELPDGSIKYTFPTSNNAKKAQEVWARAEQIYMANPNIGQAGAAKKAREELKGGTSLKDGATQLKGREGIKSYLNSLEKNKTNG